MWRLSGLDKSKSELPDADKALPGRAEPMRHNGVHVVLKTKTVAPFPVNCKVIMFGMGCFWGAERKFWSIPDIFTTAVGYAGGYTPNPTYEEVCSGKTGHNEVVLVVYDPQKTALTQLMKVFWESHNPTQGMRQGNDVGTQYRSGVYVDSESVRAEVLDSKLQYQQALDKNSMGEITTEILLNQPFYYAEDYHQQYLAKNPNGYCGLGGCGVAMP
jgi:peptide-methionine (S)-S-oxide reductase